MTVISPGQVRVGAGGPQHGRVAFTVIHGSEAPGAGDLQWGPEARSMVALRLLLYICVFLFSFGTEYLPELVPVRLGI